MAHEITSDEVTEILEEGTSKESFDVLNFIQGVALPTKVVHIYTNANAAMNIQRHHDAEAEQKELAKNLDSLSLSDDIDFEFEQASEEELEKWHEDLENSALLFELRGLAPAATTALEKSLKAKISADNGSNSEEVYYEVLQNEIVARSIVSVSTYDGKKNTEAWDSDKVADLIKNLYVSEANKLTNGALELTYVGKIFDQAVSADFS